MTLRPLLTSGAAALLTLAAVRAPAQVPVALPPPPPVDRLLADYTRGLVAAHSRPFALANDTLAGPGADFLRRQAAESQFVLIGESHEERDVPVFAAGLFRMLRSAYDFRYLAVEQDPIGTELIAGPPYRGDVRAIAGLSKRYPTLFGFSSDEDLALLALATAHGRPDRPTVWGLEQAQGAVVYLEELRRLAATDAARRLVDAQIAAARAAQPTRISPAWYLELDGTAPKLLELRRALGPTPGSRADSLLASLLTSAEIYAYYHRRERGEPVGLYNNTVREALMKANFMARYRRASRGGALPKVLFKLGQWHLYRGRSPGGAFTLGNFAHEFAIANGLQAYGLAVVPTGGNTSWGQVAAFLKPLLPPAEPDTPVVLDVRVLRPVASSFTRQLAGQGEKDDLLRFIHGYDALVLLPHGRKASYTLTGFPTR